MFKEIPIKDVTISMLEEVKTFKMKNAMEF